MFITAVVAMLSMTAAWAEGEDANMANSTEAFVLNINNYRLGEVLGLNSDQYEALVDINKTFEVEMLNAGTADKNDRAEMLNKAIHHNLAYMKYILSEKQYRKYLTILNATMQNRGLK